MGATVTHLPSLVMYFQVSVVDQVLVFVPREPPVRQKTGLCQKSDNIFHSSQEGYVQNHLIASICS